MASFGSYRNPNHSSGQPRVLPKALRNNQVYKNAHGVRELARQGLKTAVDTLRTARKTIEDSKYYKRLDSAAKKTANASDELTPKQLQDAHKTIAEWQQTARDEHDRFVAAHQRMRDMEKEAGVETKHRLARTDMFGKMYGKHGIHNIDASHVSKSDKMEYVLPWGRAYQGGRRKKTRKKRRRKNKRKTKRRKKTRRRKKRRKKRRTKRR